MLKSSSRANFDYVLVSFSKRDPKDIFTMIKSLTRWVDSEDKLYLTSFDHPKALDLKILEDVRKSNCHNSYVLINDWKKFLNGFKDQDTTPTILVTGSYYFIGEVHTFLLTSY
jgi:folylpolyglutamate synthase/dihydropteroate synthase